MLSIFIASWIKFLFLFAPFFVISMFLALTQGDGEVRKRAIIHRALIAAAIICLLLFFTGAPLFELLGITLDSFRIGAGSLLFLTAINLVNSGGKLHTSHLSDEQRDDIAVVPLAMPTIVGPATIGAVLVYGAELTAPGQIVAGLSGLACALLCLGGLLYLASTLEQRLGHTGLNILSKITGLILAAMAAQIIFTGIANFFGISPP